jgi:hypothetical protein
MDDRRLVSDNANWANEIVHGRAVAETLAVLRENVEKSCGVAREVASKQSPQCHFWARWNSNLDVLGARSGARRHGGLDNGTQGFAGYVTCPRP